jgi:hypothetical protein
MMRRDEDKRWLRIQSYTARYNLTRVTHALIFPSRGQSERSRDAFAVGQLNLLEYTV